MAIGRICQRDVATTAPGSSVLDAARLMRERHVGSLVIVEEGDGKVRPVGMITDRDIAIGVVAPGCDPASTPVGEVMSCVPVTVDEDCGIFEAIRLMREHGIRRLPVLNARGSLLGILALDDLLGLLGSELATLANVTARERRFERTEAHASRNGNDADLAAGRPQQSQQQRRISPPAAGPGARQSSA